MAFGHGEKKLSLHRSSFSYLYDTRNHINYKLGAVTKFGYHALNQLLMLQKMLRR